MDCVNSSEEIVVPGLNGRVEAYLPENKVFHYARPNNIEWNDRTYPPPKISIKEVIYDCSDLRNIYEFTDDIPQHSGYHYYSTLEDGIRAVEMGISAMQNITNNETNNENSGATMMNHNDHCI